MGINGLPNSRSILKWRMEAPANLAVVIFLRVAVGEFQRCIETGRDWHAGKIGVKRGSAKVLIVAQGPTT